MPAEPFDEFSFLAAQAAELGVAHVPPAERIALTLPQGGTVSALRFGEAAPVVTFLHGAGLNAHTWDATVLALGLPALAVDLPGHGDSSWRADARYTAATLAPDAAAAIAAATTVPQVLVGQSLGGLVAATIAADRPALVRTLVVVDITPDVDPDGDAAMLRAFFSGPADWASRDELVERALAFGLGGSREAATRGVFLNSRVRPDGRVEWKHHLARLAASGDPVASALDGTGWDALARVAAPIALIRGERGFVTEADAELFRARLPAASVHTVPTGHNVQEERPAELAELIARIAGNV
ncbi:alpha/beta fold hydrolase [Microbacterium sp.]|uniref:alpha/beta fold hydrolase n=1 Tax=Microbacterium sp. TaxID=51671 RepID=UPI0039E4827E